MEVATHHHIDRRLCGVPTSVGHGQATVRLETTGEMAADAQGLVHGGFLFGAADLAAMVAVNDPNVVLAAAEVRFLAPVRVGAVVDFAATVKAEKGRDHQIVCEGKVGERAVFHGEFRCLVLDQHVLERSG